MGMGSGEEMVGGRGGGEVGEEEEVEDGGWGWGGCWEGGMGRRARG